MMATDVIPVRVAIRVRPFSNREKAENSKECVQCFVEQGQIAINGKVFAFDSVFDPSTSQETVYDVCAAPLLEKIFDGYNCTILAYGQTGSGKTYTMGTEETPRTMQSEQRGIISRIVDGIFKHIATSETHRVSASMLEIYEEKVIDLLCATRECLQIRELKGTVFVQGLSVHPVSSLEDCMSLLEKGCQLRSKGETAMNDKSSRSHAIFTLSIEGKESEESAAFKSKLHLVDLAGSERLKKTQSEGERMREGIKINEGLLALGNVIATLSDQNSAGRHVPYRDAKITRLLQDSLGGNSFTVMITCVSPADTNAEETLSTLRYAERAKRIRNKPIVNIDPNMATIQNLREELANAKHELAMLRAGGAQISAGDVSMGPCKRCDELEKQNQKLLDDYNHRNMQLAESVAENSELVARLFAAQQTIEALRDSIKDIESKCRSNDFDEAMKIADMALKLQGPAEDEKDKEIDEIGDDDGDDETTDQAFVNRFTERQAMLNKDMANILAEIKRKELAFEATTTAQAELDKMRAAHAAELIELQAQLDAKEKEKQELLNKLKGSSIHHKLSEERRKRLQELEKEVAMVKKRLADLQRIEKEKLRLEEQSKKMNMELAELKKLRVKMSRQMKEQEVKFRKWKVAADRRMMQLKNRERKREVEVAREQRAKDLQLAIYRRKYEEANACNRRLQMQLAKCQTRPKICCEGHFTTAIRDELAVAYSAAEAQVHCEVLIEQRKDFSMQKQKLQKRLERLLKEPPAKRRTGDDRSSIDDEEEKREIEDQIKNLDREIELRGSELGDIQKKCTKAYSDEQREQRWNDLHNINEAKTGLDYLFDEAVNERRSCFEKNLLIEKQERNTDEMRKTYEENVNVLRNELRNLKNEVENLRNSLTEAQLRSAQQGRDMINIWYQMAEGRTDLPDSVLRNLHLMKEAADNFTNLHQAFDEKQREIKELRARSYHGRLRRRTGIGVNSGNKSARSVSESVVQERKEDDETNLPGTQQIREHRRPERLGVACDLDSIFSDENDDVQSVADSDYSYQPTPRQRVTHKRQSRSSVNRISGRRDSVLLNEPPIKQIEMKPEAKTESVAGCSKEPAVNLNTTYTVETQKQEEERPKKGTKLEPVPETEPCENLDYRCIVTRDLFRKH